MKKFIMFFALLSILVACKEKREIKNTDSSKYKNATLGKYVYIDKGNVLHLIKDCKAVYKEKNAVAIKPVEIDYISYECLENVCSMCVPENEIVKMDSIFQENRNAYEFIGLLYDKLKDDYIDINDELIFRKDLKDRIDLKSLYEHNKDWRFMPKTYGEFLIKIGQKDKIPPSLLP